MSSGRFIFVLLLGIHTSTQVLAQPFGIGMGTPESMLLIKEADIDPGFHQLHSVPRPHSEFEMYFVLAGHTSGVCAIRALGKSYENDHKGEDVRAAFETIKGQLDNSYGESRTDYYIKPDSELKNPDQWLKSIAEFDRLHRAIWDDRSGAALKNEVTTIALLVEASMTLGDTFLFLEYRFSNYDACQEEIENADADAL